jgi:hypothetical protein
VSNTLAAKLAVERISSTREYLRIKPMVNPFNGHLSLDFITNTHTTTTPDTPVIIPFHQGGQVINGKRSCLYLIDFLIKSELKSQILKPAFPAFVADRTIERVINQHKLDGFLPQSKKFF